MPRSHKAPPSALFTPQPSPTFPHANFPTTRKISSIQSPSIHIPVPTPRLVNRSQSWRSSSSRRFSSFCKHLTSHFPKKPLTCSTETHCSCYLVAEVLKALIWRLQSLAAWGDSRWVFVFVETPVHGAALSNFVLKPVLSSALLSRVDSVPRMISLFSCSWYSIRLCKLCNLWYFPSWSVVTLCYGILLRHVISAGRVAWPIPHSGLRCASHTLPHTGLVTSHQTKATS